MDSPLHQLSAELEDCCVCVYTVVLANQTNEPTSSYIATKGLLGSQKLKILLRVYRAVCTVESG